MSPKPPVLLVVLAHPDDETFGTGGTLALYAKRGAAVHLICATRGEVGEMDPALLQGFSSIAERRESELRCAAGVLGLASVSFLGYRDSGMPGSPDNNHPQALAAQSVEQVAAEVALAIRQLRPDVLITFDPIGGYRHPDHIAIHNATVRAFDLAADPSFADDAPPYRARKFYFQVIPRLFMRMGVRLLRLLGKDPRRFGSNGDIDLVSIAEVEFPIHARINYREVFDIRDKAAFCHESQGGKQMGGGVMGTMRKLFATSETYMRAYPPPVPGEPVERDLLAGL